MTAKKNGDLFKLQGKVSPLQALPFALQHILAMFVTNVLPLDIVAAACSPSLAPGDILILTQNAMIAAGLATFIQATPLLSSLFSLVRRRHEKESFPFVSGRSGKHFIANQLLDSFFLTRAALRAELQEDGVCSAADAENKRRLLSCLWFFDNRGIVHVGQ